ncbi:IKI3 family protein [Niveomyces insectorum RCEF 264]|uniref:Elongator complex protein 1 n=1 Tax=Niveomyces insectorum RCEF 264 TaxID=1081102 RepID=A0A162JD75_9HYPO|nr:IKI3 family protein [Niveomyces insectorum RCEF 264]
MRNLRNIRYDVCRAAVGITAACWDAGKDEAIVAFGPAADELKVRLARVVDHDELVCHDVASWDALSPNPDLPVDRVVSLHYFGDLATVCVVMAGGDIVLVREAGVGPAEAESVHIEIVGSVDPGIAAARWSPDEEVLALVTVGGALLLMSRGFETIGETALTPADLAVSKHVSVGWGKKETQFHGRGAAKAMRDPTIPEHVDEGTLSPADDGAAVTISWRGDGEYVAVNAVEQIVEDSEDNDDRRRRRRRVVRVYNREGVLDSASEPVDGLESCLSWRPAGNLMATVQRKLSSTTATATPTDENTAGGVPFTIVFFERNGLRHGQFDLRPPSVAVADAAAGDEGPVSLAWNTDSTVLAVTYPSAVQLWTMGNYHWYLKQEMATTGPALPLTAWHPEKPLRLLTSASGGLCSAEYVFAVARGALTAPDDHGAVAVVDGTSIKLTPFRAANMPPPMSLFELAVRAPAVDVVFAPDDAYVAVLHGTGVDVFSWPWPPASSAASKRPAAPTLAASHSFTTAQDVPGLVPLQIGFLPQNQGATVCVLGWNGDLHIASFGLTSENLQLDAIGTQTVARGSVLVASGQGRTLYTQDAAGILSQLDPSGLDAAPLFEKLPSLLPWAKVVEVDEDGNRVAVGRSRNGHLYANERLLAKNCTSFLVTPDHLVFTTGNHLLKFVHLADAHDLDVPLDDPEIDERCRNIEQGALLVTAIPSSLCIILQMPRGNLETIFPRAMVVAGIRKLIDALDYGKAFAFCRTQRVDMNILYDYKPDQFLANVDLFLDQLNDVAFIDLFLSSLRQEDVTQTLYKDTKNAKSSAVNGATAAPAPFVQPKRVPPSSTLSSPKVNLVCDAVLSVLVARKKTSLQNIITAHVCKKPPALDDGLRVVAQLLDRGETASAEQAVEHICFLVDVNRLYDHALGLYNLALTLLVAQQAQRDPKEYLPFIQELHEKPELWRRFAIDDHLARHEKALGHLRTLDAFPDFLEYTAKHRLYKAALGLYRYDPERLRMITDQYAGYLGSQSQFREAGLAYESLGRFAQAASCYQSAGVACWRECLFAAQSQVPPPPDDAVRELAGTLADALYEARDYLAAAAVQLDYLGSVETAVRTLCKGYEFAEAMRLAVLHRRTDLLETAVDAGLGDALSSSTELLADCRAQLKAQVPRIRELRTRAREDPLGFYEGERPGGGGGGGGADVPDDVSVAASSRLSTRASLFTRYSTGTTATGQTGETGGSRTTQQHRNRSKREEKKRARGRKGTVYEQEYLVNSVRRLVERVERARPEVHRLVAGLARRNMAERARAIEGLMAELIEACQAAIDEVWQPDTVAGPVGMPSGAVASVNDNQEVSGMEQVPAEAPPVIAAFERLSLLG